MSGWLLNSRSISNPDSAGHRVSTTAAGPSLAVFVFGTSGTCLCTPLRLWGRSRASSVCLSSASSAPRPTGATVAPPSHHKDSVLHEVALSSQDGIPKVSLRLRAPAEQAVLLIPSVDDLSYVTVGVGSRTVFWDCGFAPPGFSKSVSKVTQ